MANRHFPFSFGHRKPPRTILPTGLQMALHGQQTRCQNGGAQQTAHGYSTEFEENKLHTDPSSDRIYKVELCHLSAANDQDGAPSDESDARLLADGEVIADVQQKMDDWLKKTRNEDLLCGIDLDDTDMNNLKLDLEENSTSLETRLDGVLEFREQDKNNTLMTPQELESMPERGLEFEESVGPKELTPRMDDQLIIKSEKIEEEEEMNNDTTLTTIAFTTENQTVAKIIITGDGQSFKFTENSNLLTSNLHPIAVNNLVLTPHNTISLLNETNGNKYLSLNVISSNDQVMPVTEEQPMSIPDTDSCEKERMWKCGKPGCDRVYDKKCKLKVHLMNHSGERPFKCDIDGCDWAFATAYKLKRHIETHEGKKEYKCPHDDCTKKFTTIYNLNTHKKLHMRPNTIKCPVENCGKTFPVRRKMELHMRDHGDTEAPYKCPMESCGKEYYSANSMSTHMRVHQKMDLVCNFDGCGRKFDKACRYKQHLRQHTGERPYICQAEGCNWRFVNASKLTRHMRKHTGDRRYVCPEEGCGKSFMRAEHLQGHVVVHSKSKPFKCTFENCNACFTAKSSLYVHLKKHKGNSEKVIYPCPIEMCHKRYNCKSSLRLHMLKFHTPVLADNQLDYITLFANEDLQEITMHEITPDMATTGTASVAVSVPSIAIPSSLADAANLVSPSNFISSATFQQSAELLPQENNNIITQSVTDEEERNFTNTTVLQNDLQLANDAVMPNELEVPTSRLFQENKSGSARTDFCSNHILLNKARKSQELKVNLEDVLTENRMKSETDDHLEEIIVPSSVNLSQSDVVLTTTAIAFGHTAMGAQFVQSHLLHDDSHSVDLFHDDNLLVPIASNSLLSESTSAEFNTGNISLIKDLE